MAIVINGSGTVTGISVGGLPDDIVDAGMMADNSIDSDAYVDASIDNAHLADDAVGVAELSASGTASSSTFLRGDNAWAAAGGGKLLQIQYVNLTTEWTISGTSEVDLSGLTATITPASTSSKIICMLQSGVGNNNAGSYMTLKLYRASTEIAHRVTERNSSYQYQMATLNYVDSPSTTSATTYKITGQRNATGQHYLGINGTTTSLVLMEIE